MTKCNLGDIVLSKNGKYKDELFVVVSLIDEKFCALVNGKDRKLCHPKKKKVKHLIACSHNSELEQKLQNNAYILDSDIRKIISNYKISN